MNPLIPKIVEAKKLFQPFLKNRKAYKYNYADLDELVSKSSEGLSSQGLVVYYTIDTILIGDKHWLAINAHLSDGENEMTTTVKLPIEKLINAQNPAQEIGGVITYGRRYAFCALFNITAEEDTDAVDQSSDDFREPHKRPLPANQTPIKTAMKDAPKEKTHRDYVVDISNYIKIHGRPSVASSLNILEDDIEGIKGWNLKDIKDGVEALYMLLGPLQQKS
jgi:ERF superfamily